MNLLFGFAAEFLIERIRGMAFNTILNKDIEYFDLTNHGTGMLTSSLSSDVKCFSYMILIKRNRPPEFKVFPEALWGLF